MPRKKLNVPLRKPLTKAIDNEHVSENNQTLVSLDTYNGYVVAIGASAGGLDALERFFDELAPNSGAAFVVIQHLSPDHKSMMDNLLARHTQMPVNMAENGMQIRANHVFLIPPGKNMTVSGSELRLIPKNPHGLSLPIDLFFSSLAKEFGNRSIGAILSGTGSDGTRGAVAINDAGGFLLAQDPETAKFDGMPRSVISTGLVDEIMPAELLAKRIVSHVSNTIISKVIVNENRKTDSQNPMEEILHLLYQIGGINFKEYKSATIQRRLERRMQVRHTHDISNYLHLLENDRNEVMTLKRDLLIPVTSFFRDDETFELLQKSVINNIIEERIETQPIRVWVAACSTGEEAYTLAILFAEAFDRLKRWPLIKIFATDVEQQYVDFASSGAYSEAIANEISPERLERFFTHSGNQYIVRNEIRQNIIFAKHNMLDDPPFTRIHLVSCRNALIYLDTPAQEKALLRFQYSLTQNGYLLLGSSESLGSRYRDFNVINAKHKIYRLLRQVSLPLDIKSQGNGKTLPRVSTKNSERQRNSEANIIDVAQTSLMKNYAVPSLLVNEDRELVHVYGDARRFMQVQEGAASLDLSKLLVGKLAPVGLALLHKVAKENQMLGSETQLFDPIKASSENIRIIVRPLSTETNPDRYFLMSFETMPPHEYQLTGDQGIDLAEISNERIQSLERELAANRDSLQATIEELETANEELQATNEELMASNEELQSTNEELQSVNEELYTVNSENQEKIEILNHLNADLDNMTRAALIPTIFVDASLKLTRFTPEVGNIFRIREGDIGRSIEDFTHTMDYVDFMTDLSRVIESGQMLQREVRTLIDNWYLLRILPYLNGPGKIRGAVMTFVDITHIKDAQRLQRILDSLPECIAVLDTEGVITTVNRCWREFTPWNDEQMPYLSGPGAMYLEVFANQMGADISTIDAVRLGIKQVLKREKKLFSLKYSSQSPSELRWFRIHAVPIDQVGGGLVVNHADITDWFMEHKHE